MKTPAVSNVCDQALFRFVPRLFHESPVYGDWDIWIRLAANGPVAFAPDVVASYRVHGANLTVEHDEAVARRRTLDVLQAIEDDAEEIGGELVRPRTRAALRLEIVLRYYRAGALEEAERWTAAAFAADRTLENDAAWLRTWLFERLDRRGPPDDLPAWLLTRVPARVQASLGRRFAAFRLEQPNSAASGSLRGGSRRARSGSSRRARPSRHSSASSRDSLPARALQ